jgi:hypothetical protein
MRHRGCKGGTISEGRGKRGRYGERKVRMKGGRKSHIWRKQEWEQEQ